MTIKEFNLDMLRGAIRTALADPLFEECGEWMLETISPASAGIYQAAEAAAWLDIDFDSEPPDWDDILDAANDVATMLNTALEDVLRPNFYLTVDTNEGGDFGVILNALERDFIVTLYAPTVSWRVSARTAYLATEDVRYSNELSKLSDREDLVLMAEEVADE